MWFLLLQISILMLLATALGAALMWWWLSRRHESLAQSRERLLAQASRLDNLATAEDVTTHATAILAAVSGQKPVDLDPVRQDIAMVRRAVADLRLPETDLSPIGQRIDALEARLAVVSLDPVIARVGQVGAAIEQMKPAIEERLSRLEAAMRELRSDLGPMHAGIVSVGLSVNALDPKLGDLGARIDTQRRSDMEIIASRFSAISATLGALRGLDNAPVMQRLAEVQAAIANIRMPDLGAVQQRLGDLQAAIAGIPQPNLQPLHASLADLEAFVVALDKPPQDFGPLFNRLSMLDAALANVQAELREAAAFKSIERRLASLEEALGSMPGPDLSPVINAVRSIDSRHDLVAVENRLTGLEYGLAALHHMMRSRAEGLRDPGDVRSAPSLQVVRQNEQPLAPHRPDRESDPVTVFLRAEDQANLLTEPAFGAPDDLERIAGVGPMLRDLLHQIGVYYFWQVAEWTPAEVEWVDSKLMHFRGRIRRDDWVGQARVLAAAPGATKRPTPSAARRPL